MSESQHVPITVGDNTLIRRNESLLVAPVHDETVMMDIKSGHYYGLDDIGTQIWKHLGTPRTFGDLVDTLVSEFDADRAVIAQDVQVLLTLMAEKGVVTLG